jgi:hypothetical protein
LTAEPAKVDDADKIYFERDRAAAARSAVDFVGEIGDRQKSASCGAEALLFHRLAEPFSLVMIGGRPAGRL